MSSHGCRQSFLKGNISIYWLLLPFVLQLIVIRILANYLTSRYSEVISDPLLNPNSITLLLGLPVIVSMGLGYLILRWINRSHLGLSEVHEDSLQNNSNTEDTSEQKQI